jgi:branched-chain amino acid aminotransferase
MLSRRKVWINGSFVPFAKAQVHLLSHSFGRGSALFEVMSVHATSLGTAVFRLEEHLARLAHSAELSRMKLPLSRAALARAIKETVAANQVRAGMAKLICYYGEVEFEVVPRNPQVSVMIAAVDPLRDLDAARFNKELRGPASATISPWRKISPRTVPVECKCAANYMGGMIAKLDAIKAGFSNPVLLDLDGNLAEGATESLFLVKNGVLKTAALGNILPSISRRSLLEIARDIDWPVQEKKLKPRDLMTADEAFFASSTAKTWPIAMVDGRALPHAPGEVTRLLDNVMEKILTGKVKAYRKWLTLIK